MSAARLPSSYLPVRHSSPSHDLDRSRPPSRWSIWAYLKFALVAGSTLVGIHAALAWIAPDHPYVSAFRTKVAGVASQWRSPGHAGYQIDNDMANDGRGAFFRDARPIQTILAFWDLAEREVLAQARDTCDDKLGRRFIEAYASTNMAYCVPESMSASATSPLDDNSTDARSYITCNAIHRHDFTNWWPYPAAPCLSSNLRMIKDERRTFRAAGCDVTDDGARLLKEMKKEDFAGVRSTEIAMDDTEASCRETIRHATLLIGRQDQWNPFHVAEDLITTVVTLLLAAHTAPDLVNQRLQLIFLEGFGMDQNHFTPLWDRMGAWAPRRLSLDPWGDGVCLSTAIHSVGAGASFLSAPGVDQSFSCASTVTWAASHYFRHLFGLLPTSPIAITNVHSSQSRAGRTRRPINVLWLSRAKLDAYAMSHNDWSKWRGVRHIKNEPALVDRIKTGIASFCGTTHDDCLFEDATQEPERWADTAPLPSTQPVPIRFASIDPTVHALGTQVSYVGHSTILVSSHGGALGLSLFLPPGEGVIVELQVKDVENNFHFQHMASEMGHVYQLLRISRNVNVDMVWQTIEEELQRLLG